MEEWCIEQRRLQYINFQQLSTSFPRSSDLGKNALLLLPAGIHAVHQRRLQLGKFSRGRMCDYTYLSKVCGKITLFIFPKGALVPHHRLRLNRRIIIFSRRYLSILLRVNWIPSPYLNYICSCSLFFFTRMLIISKSQILKHINEYFGEDVVSSPIHVK